MASEDEVEAVDPPESVARPRRRGFVSVVAAVTGIAVAGSGALWLWANSGGAPRDEEVRPAADHGGGAPPAPDDGPAPGLDLPPEVKDAEFRKAIAGRWWRNDYYGKATLDLMEDGSGTMAIEFSGLYYYAVGERVDADIAWKVENGRAIFDSLRGRPQAAFARVTKEKGTRRDRLIIQITDEQMVLKDDLDDGSVARWERVK